MTHDIIGTAAPGCPQVTVYGIIRCMPTSGGMSAGGDRQAPSKSLYILYLEVKAVVNNRHWDEFAMNLIWDEDQFSYFSSKIC